MPESSQTPSSPALEIYGALMGARENFKAKMQEQDITVEQLLDNLRHKKQELYRERQSLSNYDTS